MTPPATCILTGTIESPPGTPVVGALVRVRTIAVQLLNNGAGSVVNDLTTYTAADGTFSLTLTRGLYAQLDIDEVGLYADVQIPDLATVDLSALTLNARGSLTPLTIVSSQGPSAGGDLTGTFPNPSVIAFRSVPLFADTPTDGKVWVYRSADGGYRLESFPVTAAVQSVTAGQGLAVTGPTTSPTVAVANGGIVAAMLATGAAASNVGSLGGDLSGSLPSPQIAAGAIVDADVNPAANVAWSKISKVGAVPADVGALGSGTVIAAINASAEAPKIAPTQLQDIPESKVTNLVADLAAKRNTADAIPQADVAGLIAALAAKEATANKGAIGGYASLDGSGKVPLTQLPATLLADGDKGDVTVAGGGASIVIDSKAVTYAKMQDVSAPDRVLGAVIAGSPVEIPFTAFARSLADDTDAPTARTTLGLGTASTRNVAAAGDAAAAEVVKGDDSRLTNARTPTAHSHVEGDVTGLTAALAGKVPVTRSVNTTGPLAGGGALSGDLTLTVADATTGAVGVVKLAGDLAGTGLLPSVASVGGQTAANVAAGVALANAATAVNTPSTIVRRDAGGNVAVNVVGNVTGNVSGTAANVTGVVAIANGGTGQTTALAAFDALAPTSAKGDFIGYDGAQSVRVPVGADGTVPIADSTQAAGFRWGTGGGSGSVTSVGTGNGLQGGPITGVGTIDLRLNAAGGLSKILGVGLNELGIAAGGVSDAMLATPKANAARLINTTAPLTGGGDLSADRTLGVSGATTLARGVVRLAGDLGGTADAPTVEQVGGQPASDVADATLFVYDATSANTANTIVKRDASGGFAMGVLAATDGQFSGDVYADGSIETAGNVTAGSIVSAPLVQGELRDTGGYAWNVRVFGADPTGAADSTTAINSAIAQMGGPGVLYFPAGTYKYSTLTMMGSVVELRGAGAGLTTLITTTTAGTAISVTGSSRRITDLTLSLAGAPVAPQRHVNVTGGVTFERVNFANWHTGIISAGDVKFIDCSFQSPAAGALIAIGNGFGATLYAERTSIGTKNTPITSKFGISSTTGASRPIRFRSCDVHLTGDGTALYTSYENDIRADDCTFVGSGSGYAIDNENSQLTLNGVRAYGGTHALYMHEQSYTWATDTVFDSDDSAISNASSHTVLLDMDGTAFFQNVVVGAPGNGLSCVRGENSSAWLLWHGGQLRCVNGLGRADYGVSWDGDGADLHDVTSLGAPNVLLLSGTITPSVASAPIVSIPFTPCRITGTATIQNITTTTTEPLHLISTDGFSLGASGNIATAVEAMPGTVVTLTYDVVDGLWIPNSAVHGAPWAQDLIAVGGGGLHLDTSTVFKYVASTNRMGVGTATPLGTVHAVSANTDPAIIAQRVGNAGGVEARRCNNTLAAPTALTSGQQIGGLTAVGHDGTAYSASQGAVVVIASESWTVSAHGTSIDFVATPNGSTTPVTVARMTGGRLVGIGAAATGPAATLDVGGSLATRVESKTLANGLNSNIAVTSSSFIRIIGLSAGFSVGGFTNGSDGRILRVYNTTSQTMTIVNEDASSTAANRILTLTGANVALRVNSPSFATFIYDATASRWILTATN